MADDRERFTALYRRHLVDVERYLRRRAPEISVSDAAAEVFTVAWRRLDEVPDPPLPWLYGVARRVLANQLRGVHRARRLTDRVGAVAGGDAPLPDHAEQVAGRLALAAAFDGLAEADREVLRLVAWEGLSLRDGATAAGCSLPAFAMRLHRARRRLRDALATRPVLPPRPSRAVSSKEE